MSKDERVKVKVVFTIDVNHSGQIFEAQDVAERITKEVFKESFSRAHILKIRAVEILTLD